MATIASLEVAITANTTAVERGLAQTNTLLNQMVANSGAANTSVIKMAQGFAVGTVAAQAFVGAVKAVTGGLLGFATGSVKAASDISESMNKVDVVFGSSADSVKEFAKTSAQALGQSEASALSALGQFGNLFKAMGLGQTETADLSKQIVSLGSDLASFNNIKPEDALEKLRAGLVGEAEPLRALGVNLNETIVKAKALAMGFTEVDGQLSESAKIQARYALILEQTRDAQGDFARTSTGMANAQRIISASFENIQAQLGGQLLPAIAPVISAFATALPDALRIVQPAIASMGATIAGFAAQVGPTIAALREALGFPAQAAAAAATTPAPAYKPPAANLPVAAAKDYTAQVKAASAELHGIDAELTAITAKQTALKYAVEDTTKRYEDNLRAIKDDQENINAQIEATKVHYEGLLAPLEKQQQALGRLADDTKAKFAAIAEPLKTALDITTRRIADAKVGYEAVVRPIQAQIAAIDKANNALSKQRALESQIADIKLRQRVLDAAGDPKAQGEIARQLKLNEFRQDDINRQIELLQLTDRKGNHEKQIARLTRESNGIKVEGVKLEQRAADLVNRGATAQIEKDRIILDAAKEKRDLAQDRASIEAGAAKAPLEDQLAKLEANFKRAMDPLEAQQRALTARIEATARAETAALKPIIDQQAELARKIEDVTQAQKDALAPLEAIQKGLTDEATRTEAAQRAALAPLREQQTALERQRDTLEQSKKEIQGKIDKWKDEKAAIDDAAAAEAKRANPPVVAGGQPGAKELEPGKLSIGAQPLPKSLISPGLIADFKNLAANVQATADAFNNLDKATSGSLHMNMGDIAKDLALYAGLAVTVGWIGRLALGFKNLLNPSRLLQLAIAGVLFVVTKSAPDFLAGLKTLGDDWNTWVDGQGRNWDTFKQDWGIFWHDVGLVPGPEGVAWQKILDDGWAGWLDRESGKWEAYKTTWGTFWTQVRDTPGPFQVGWMRILTQGWDGWLTTEGQKWEAYKQNWGAFWDGVGKAVKEFFEPPWNEFTKWLKSAIEPVTSWIKPIKDAFQGIGEAINNLPQSLPDWWTKRPGWLGGTGGVQQTSFTGPGGMLTGNTDKDAMVAAAAARFGIDPGIFARMIKQESGDSLDLGLTSSAGARGPGQFMPGTGNEAAGMLGVSQEDFWSSAELQIQGAAAELAKYLQLFGSYRNALVAYNAGPGADFNNLYEETQRYLDAILGSQTAMNNYLTNLDKVGNTQMNMIPATQQIGAGIPTAMAAGMVSTLPVVVAAATLVNGQVVTMLAPPVQQLNAYGESIPDALASGVRAGTSTLVDSVSNMIRRAENALERGDIGAWEKAFNVNLPPLQGFAHGGVKHGDGPAYLHDGELVVPRNMRSSGGDGDTYVFNFPNYAGSKEELVGWVRDGLTKTARKSGGSSRLFE